MKNILLFTVILGLVSWIGAANIHAQEASISIRPAIEELVVRPGQSLTVPYVLTNLGDPQQISLKIVSLTPQADGTIQVESKLVGPLQISLLNSDIGISQPFFMKNDEKKAFSLVVQIPQAIQEKDYYIGLVAQSQAPPTNEGAITARVQLGLVSKILMSVTSDGSLETRPEVVMFRLDSKNKISLLGRTFNLVRSGEKVPLILEVSNQGRHLIDAQGIVTLNGMGPKKNLPLPSRTILASTQGSISTELPGFFFGPYTISATVNFGQNSPVIFATTYAFAIPNLETIIGTILAIVALSALVIIKRRS